MEPSIKTPQPSQISFINALAWVFIVLAGMSTFIGILQNIMINTFFPLEQMNAAMKEAGAAQQMPAIATFMFANMRLFFLATLLVSALALASAIGLLKRKNWARLCFIGLMVLAIAWSLLGIVFQQAFFSSMPTQAVAHAPDDFRRQFETMTTVIKGATIVMALGMSGLFGWIVKRLVSPEIRAEFR